jgi:hypothetical protein
MKFFFYFLTTVFGLFGTLSALYTMELLMNGRFLPMQLLIALAMFALAVMFLKKAREKVIEQK